MHPTFIFLFLFISLNLQNACHFFSATALFYGSVSSLWNSLAACIYQRMLQSKIHMSGSLLEAVSIQGQIAFSLQLNHV